MNVTKWKNNLLNKREIEKLLKVSYYLQMYNSAHSFFFLFIIIFVGLISFFFQFQIGMQSINFKRFIKITVKFNCIDRTDRAPHTNRGENITNISNSTVI